MKYIQILLFNYLGKEWKQTVEKLSPADRERTQFFNEKYFFPYKNVYTEFLMHWRELQDELAKVGLKN